MKKVLLLTLFFLCSVSVFAQRKGAVKTIDVPELTPGGWFDDVFDHYGNKYRLIDLQAPASRKPDGTVTQSLPGCSSGIFNLYFEAGSGMDDTSNPVHMARRAVVCNVFQYISSMLVAPAGTVVNIGVRDINAYGGLPSNVLGLASAIYTAPNQNVGAFGGIVDSEIWKTIHTGVNSYDGVVSPLNATSLNAGGSGIFYHGVVAFNFSPSYSWNTNTSINCPAGMYDLYSVALHEIIHGMGFQSLINSNGISILGTGYRYFTRYDRFLRNNANTQPLITNSGACSVMYDYSFTLNTSILSPSSACQSNNTVQANAIRYVSSQNIPVYTPNCFELGSSLSHFEDQWYTPPAGFPSGNDQYFTLSNAEIAGTTKRILRAEERKVLCDIGYILTASGGATCPGISVSGKNDGLSASGYTYTGNPSVNIPIAGLLSNDVGATGFECLQDVFATASQPTSLSATSGTSATTVNFNSATAGLHLLRYVPYNSLGQRGNITYVFVYVKGPGCATAVPCSLVINGNFEQHTTGPNNFGQISRACGWQNGNGQSVDYFATDATNPVAGIPCNAAGYIADSVPGNGAYAGFVVMNNGQGNGSRESLATTLKEPLLPNTTYTLTMDVSLANASSNSSIQLQAYFNNGLVPGAASSLNLIPIPNPAMLFTSPVYANVANAWQRLTFTITTTTGGETVLYLGSLTANPFQNVTVTPTTGCDNGVVASAYYYIDNVLLVPTYGAQLNLPATVCPTAIVSNLASFLTAAPPGGTFSGPGVTGSAGNYSFNAATAGVGTHAITYTYTANLGCTATVSDYITVTPPVTPTFNQVQPKCQGTSPFSLPQLSTNGITGTWSPSVNTNATTTYTFTPNAGQCAGTTTMTITVNATVKPKFAIIPPQCAGTIESPLPTTSINGISGVWSPAWNPNATTTYTFTPNPGSCSGPVNLTVTITQQTIPTFAAIGTLCSGINPSPLPTTSTNGITGTWAPAWNPNATTTYMFTPNTGQCATSVRVTVSISPRKVTSFRAIAAMCEGNSISPLPPTSLDGVPGTWSPVWNPNATTTYTFTPNAGYCYYSVAMTVTILPTVVPAFDPVGPYCYGAAIPPLPTTSTNGITGTWSPALDNTATTTYGFTPNDGECAKAVKLTIKIYAANDPLCCTDCVRTKSGANATAPIGLVVYPNPSNGKVTLQLSAGTIHKITITALDGKRVYTGTLAQNTSETLDVSDFADGIYTITVEANDGSFYIQKLLKKG